MKKNKVCSHCKGTHEHSENGCNAYTMNGKDGNKILVVFGCFYCVGYIDTKGRQCKAKKGKEIKLGCPYCFGYLCQEGCKHREDVLGHCPNTVN